MCSSLCHTDSVDASCSLKAPFVVNRDDIIFSKYTLVTYYKIQTRGLIWCYMILLFKDFCHIWLNVVAYLIENHESTLNLAWRNYILDL